MNRSEEKDAETLVETGEPRENEKNGSLATDKAMAKDAPPARPVRMKWGRVIEEEPVPPPEPEKEEKPAPPKPDPRIEALRERLAREERARAEAEKERAEKERAAVLQAAEEKVGFTESREEKTPSKESRRNAVRRRAAVKKEHASPEEKKTADRRATETDIEKNSDEIVRMRAELERAELLKKIRKKRRKDDLRAFVLGILGGIWSLLRRIRISKRFLCGILVTVLLSGLSAVILGNLLKDRVGVPEDSSDITTEPESEAETVPFGRDLAIPDLNAGIVSLEGATMGSIRGEAQRFANAGVTAVSLILRNADGQLLFSSKTDEGLGLDGEAAADLRISEILDPFLSREIYVSCILPMRYFSDGDGYSRSVLYAYETALLSEIAEAGAQEVILLDCDGLFDANGDKDGGDGAFSTEDAVRELQAIARAVNEKAPETAVGIAFSPEFLATRDSDRYLGSIVEAFDLLLLDLRAAQKAEDLYEAVSTGVSEHLYFILRYSMRVLIPEGSAEAVTRVSVGNWQEGTLPKASNE